MPPQRIAPYLIYRDAPAAIDFLCAALGFEERSRMEMPDGRLGHAELGYPEGDGSHDGAIMLASVWEEMGFASPRELPGCHAQVYLRVEDVDAHFARARAAGATIAAEPEDQSYGARTYRVVDPEGHRWMISQDLPQRSEITPESR